MIRIKELDKTQKSVIIMFACIIAMLIMSILFMFAEFGNPGIAKIIDGGAFDARMYFNSEDVRTALYNMGNPVEDVKACLVYHIVDYLYIISYFLSFATMALVFIPESKKLFRKIAFGGAIACIVFDICENVFLDVVMMVFIMQDFNFIAGLATAGSVFSLLKEIAVLLMCVYLCVFIIRSLVVFFKSNKAARASELENRDMFEEIVSEVASEGGDAPAFTPESEVSEDEASDESDSVATSDDN